MIPLLDQNREGVRSDNRPRTSLDKLSTMDNGGVDGSSAVGRTYRSLPNIVPYPEQSSDDASRHSLRTKPSDALDCNDAVQVCSFILMKRFMMVINSKIIAFIGA